MTELHENGYEARLVIKGHTTKWIAKFIIEQMAAKAECGIDDLADKLGKKAVTDPEFPKAALKSLGMA